MKKGTVVKIVSASLLSLVLVMSTGTSFLAADGTEPSKPEESSHKATVTGEPAEDGTVTLYVEEDDDAIAKDSDTSATDIGVWATVDEYGDVVYKIDIAWGDMKFEFKNQSGKWNPETHTYDAVDGANQAWVVDYIDGTNNKITVTNHSNAVVNAQFTYAHVGTPFNVDASGADAVRGHFFADNADALVAAKVLTNSATVTNALTTSIKLGHQDIANLTEFGGTTDENGVLDDSGVTTGELCQKAVYFTFNGTVDESKISGLADFTRVGTITVTITPETP